MSPTFPSKAPIPIPTLLPPPGPAVRSIRVLPTGITTDPAEHRPIPQLFYDALAVRDAVFIVEQKCSAEKEIDAEDEISWHWVIYAEPSGGEEEVPAATIRLVPAQAHADADDAKPVDGPNYKGSTAWDHNEPYVMIGRVATVKEFRGRGYGRVLVEKALWTAGNNAGSMLEDERLTEWKGLVLAHAQKWVEKWYHSLGFVTDKGMGTWWEEGIKHVAMWKRVDVKK
jgi:predicted GNAT family N-acyltransferase